MIRIGPLDPHAGFVASDNLRLTENGLRLIRFDLEPRMRADEHIHQRALAYDQAESVAEHEAQTLVGKRLKALAIYRQRRTRGPNGVCVATEAEGPDALGDLHCPNGALARFLKAGLPANGFLNIERSSQRDIEGSAPATRPRPLSNTHEAACRGRAS